MTDPAEDRALARLRSLRENYATRAAYWPEPCLAWADAVRDLDEILRVIFPGWRDRPDAVLGDAWDAGYIAADNGRPETANPYRPPREVDTGEQHE